MINCIQSTEEILFIDRKLELTLLAPATVISKCQTDLELTNNSFIAASTNCRNYMLPASCLCDSVSSLSMFNNQNILFVLKHSCILAALNTLQNLLASRISCESPTLLRLGEQHIGFSQLLSFDSPINLLNHLTSSVPVTFRAAASSKIMANDSNYDYMKCKEINYSNHIKKLRKGSTYNSYPVGAAYLNSLIDWKSENRNLLSVQNSDYVYNLIQYSTTLSKNIEKLFLPYKSNNFVLSEFFKNMITCFNKFIPTFSNNMSSTSIVDALLFSLHIEEDFPLALIQQIGIETMSHNGVDRQLLQSVWKQLVAFPDPFSRNFFLSAAFEILDSRQLEHISEKYFREIGNVKAEESVVYIPNNRFDKPIPINTWHSILKYFFYYISEITLPVLNTNFFITLFKSICEQKSLDMYSVCQKGHHKEQFLILRSMYSILQEYVATNLGYFLWHNKWNTTAEDSMNNSVPYFTKSSHMQSYDSVDQAPQRYLSFEKKYFSRFSSNKQIQLFNISMLPDLFNDDYILTDNIHSLLKSLFSQQIKKTKEFSLFKDCSALKEYPEYQKNIAEQNVLLILNATLNSEECP